MKHSSVVYKNATTFVKGEWCECSVMVEDGMIQAISECANNTHTVAENNRIEPVDLNGYRLIPGVIDVHTHGCLGFDFSHASEEEIKIMEDYYIRKGVTGVLATVMTNAPEALFKAMKTIKAYREANPTTIIKGIHLEGPFFGASKKGAHDSQFLRVIDCEWFKELDDTSGNFIKLVSIDPTLEGAEDFIKQYGKSKTIAIGHTDASYEKGLEAVEAGASQITHLFNAMNGLHHRNPGLIGVMNDTNVKVELITDGIHVHPSVVRMCFKLNPEKMIIISDSISAAGLKEGETCLSGGMEVTIKEGRAVIAGDIIAGSTYTGFEAMRQAIAFGVDEKEAILSATERPAKTVGDLQIGKIEIGYHADLLVIDEAYELKAVIHNGKLQWLA